MSTTTTDRIPTDHLPADHEGLTVPELLDLIEGRPPRRARTPQRSPELVAGARAVTGVVRRAVPPAAAAVRRVVLPAAAAVRAAAGSAGTGAARSARPARATSAAWPEAPWR